MKFEDVEHLEYTVQEQAEMVACGISGTKPTWCECERCRELLSLAGGKRGFEVLIANMLVCQLLVEYGDELDVDLAKVFGSVKGLKAFQNKFKAKCLQ